MKKKQKLNKIEKILAPFKGVFVMLETFAKMLIAVVTLYIVGSRPDVYLSTFQIVCIDVAMLYWICKPLFKYFREVFLWDQK